MRRIFPGLIFVAACSRAPATASSVVDPPLSSIVPMEQVVPGTVVGHVTDETGRPLPDGVAQIDYKMGAHTDSTGRFRFDGVKPGIHTIRVLHVGFNPAVQAFTLEAGSGAAFAVRLTRSSFQLTEVCLTNLEYSVGIRVRDIRGTTIEVAHGDSVQRFVLDTLRYGVDANGMRTVNAFEELPGRFYVTVAAPGYRDWQTNVLVRPGSCHVQRQVVTAELRR